MSLICAVSEGVEKAFPIIERICLVLIALLCLVMIVLVFMQITDGTLFTDFSKSQLVAMNLSNTSQRRRLGGSGIVKVAAIDNKIYLLNSKGTLFVHENNSDFTQIGNMALSFDNQLVDIMQNQAD